MNDREKELRAEYFDGPASDSMSLKQFFLSQGFNPDKPVGMRIGGLARGKRKIARGCGAVMEKRRKKTLHT